MLIRPKVRVSSHLMTTVGTTEQDAKRDGKKESGLWWYNNVESFAVAVNKRHWTWAGYDDRVFFVFFGNNGIWCCRCRVSRCSLEKLLLVAWFIDQTRKQQLQETETRKNVFLIKKCLFINLRFFYVLWPYCTFPNPNWDVYTKLKRNTIKISFYKSFWIYGSCSKPRVFLLHQFQ